jgi:hypothetical protein
MLEFLDSGFAIGAKEFASYEDLIISTFLCSHDYEEGLAQFESKTLRLRLKLWSLFCGNFDVAEAIGCFYQYVNHYAASPGYWLTESSGASKSTVSFAQSLKVKMMQEFGMSEVEALNTPYNAALVNYLTVLESKGAIQFMTDEDEQLIAKVKSMEKRLQEIAAKVSNR